MNKKELEVIDMMPAINIPKFILRIDEKTMSPIEKLVYCVLYKKANTDTGETSLVISPKFIAMEIGATERSVEKALRKLQKSKFIKKVECFPVSHYVFLIHESFSTKENNHA